MSAVTDLLYPDFPAEHESTRRVLSQYPDGRGDWRPHDRSRTVGELATHVADIVNRGAAVLATEGLDVSVRRPTTTLDSAADLLASFEAGLARFEPLLDAVELEHLAQSWRVHYGDATLLQAPRRVLLRTMMMSHLIHHRAQLGVYYRLMGVVVPGTYGPSADETGR